MKEKHKFSIDYPTFSLLKWSSPTKRGFQKALKDGDFLSRVISEEQPKSKGRNARRRAYKRAKRLSS